MDSGITRDDWLKAMQAAGYDEANDDPSAVTIREFAEMFGVTLAVAKHRLTALESRGLATQTYKWGLTPYRRRVRLIAYRLVTP